MPSWSYSRCVSCDCQHRQVIPDGPVDAKIMLIDEGPGRQEDKTGIPFVGVSGQELDQTYLRLAGLDRGEVFVTNMVQCRQERNGIDIKPADNLRDVCSANHLIEEIHTVQPEIVILCGATACSLLGKCDLELEHGFPRRADLYGHECWTVPMYHPAAGMHETRYMTPMLEDWDRLGKWMRHRWRVPNEPVKTDYTLVDSVGPLPGRIAIDTESDESKPYSIQWSGKPGQAFMLLLDGGRGLAEFRRRMASDRPEVVMHNAVYDLEVLDRLGVHVDRFRDTMQELYHLGNLPQGLKAAVYRIFGYRMTSYDEVVTPYSKAKLETWLCEALACASEMRLEIPHPVGPDCPTCGKRHRKDMTDFKPHAAEAVLRRVLSKLNTDYDPWELPKMQKGVEKPRLIGRDWMADLEAQAGRMPRRSIIHAPLDQQVFYGCSDADWTLRLAKWLEGERKRITEEEWKIAA